MDDSDALYPWWSLACWATPAIADVTMTSQVTGKGIGKAAESQSIVYIKGLKMRNDSTLGDTPTTMIIDIETQKFISINHKKKEAQVFDMAQFRQDMDKTMKGGQDTGHAQAQRTEARSRRQVVRRLRHRGHHADGPSARTPR